VDGQILPFTVGTNGTLNSLVGGAIAGDQTETDPLFVLTESKGKYLYVANEGGSGINNGAGMWLIRSIPPPASSRKIPARRSRQEPAHRLHACWKILRISTCTQPTQAIPR